MKASRRSIYINDGKLKAIAVNGPLLKKQQAAAEISRVRDGTIAALQKQLQVQNTEMHGLKVQLSSVRTQLEMNTDLIARLKRLAAQPVSTTSSEQESKIKQLTSELAAEKIKSRSLEQRLQAVTAAFTTAKRQAEAAAQQATTFKNQADKYAHQARRSKDQNIDLVHRYNILAVEAGAAQAPILNPYGSLDQETITALQLAVRHDLSIGASQQLARQLGINGRDFPEDPISPFDYI